MSQAIARAQAEAQYDSGRFFGQLAQRVACRTESQNPARSAELQAYLDEQMAPALQALGFDCTVHASPVAGAPPLLTAQRLERWARRPARPAWPSFAAPSVSAWPPMC